MASLRYTNLMLTVIALLLTLHLWTIWIAPGPRGADGIALAPGPRTAHAAGLPNAGQQRKQMVDLLKKISTQSDELNKLFASGRARVRMEESRDGDRPRNR